MSVKVPYRFKFEISFRKSDNKFEYDFKITYSMMIRALSKFENWTKFLNRYSYPDIAKLSWSYTSIWLEFEETDVELYNIEENIQEFLKELKENLSEEFKNDGFIIEVNLKSESGYKIPELNYSV